MVRKLFLNLFYLSTEANVDNHCSKVNNRLLKFDEKNYSLQTNVSETGNINNIMTNFFCLVLLFGDDGRERVRDRSHPC